LLFPLGRPEDFRGGFLYSPESLTARWKTIAGFGAAKTLGFGMVA
jgi:hypothetical protein